MKEIPRSFGDIKNKFLQMIIDSSALWIDIFDRYKTSIKDNECMQRGKIAQLLPFQSCRRKC